MRNSKYPSVIKNTVILYFRTLLVLLLGLFSTRLALSFLGNENFGIVNVVNSVVTLSYFLHSALIAMSQRYLTFAVGKGELEQLAYTLKNILFLHCCVAFGIVVILESVGLCFVTKELNIPAAQKSAALIVYHTWVGVACCTLLQIPWQSLLIAYEKMDLFASVTVFEAVLKIALLSGMFFFEGNRLILYVAAIFITSVLIFFTYCVIGKILIGKNTTSKGRVDRSMLISMSGFSSWYLLGGIAFYFMFQGGNILVNLFFGTLVNAAMGIAFQIYGALSAFSGNIRQAIEPRIVKNFASGNNQMMTDNTFIGARYTFYLLFIFILPGLVDVDAALKLWLSSPPPQAALFCSFIMIFVLFQSFDLAFASIFKATGQVKENQIYSAVIYLLTLPVTYVLFKIGMPVIFMFFIQVTAAFIVGLVIKFLLMSKVLGVSMKYYFQHLLKPLLKTLFPCLIPVGIVIVFLPPGLFRGIVHGICLTLTMVFSCLYLDLEKKQRQIVLSKLYEVLNRFHHKEKNI